MTTVEARACRPIIPDPIRPDPLATPTRSDAETPHLLAYLATVPDPRARAGRRHPLVAILAMAAAAVLAGARSMAAIAEWAADAPQPVRAALGARRDRPRPLRGPGRGHHPPHPGPPGRRRAGRRDRRVAGRPRPRPRTARRRAVAVDGKTLRGARRDGRPGPPAGRDGPRHPRGAGPTPGRRRARRGARLRSRCWPAWTWPARWSPPTRCRPTPTPPSSWSTGKHAHYLFIVKANQPTLLARCQRCPGIDVPVLDRTRDRGHGRIEIRTLKAVTVARLRLPARRPGHPGHPQDPRPCAARRWRTVTVYAVTSLAHAQASPARLADCSAGTGRSRRCTTSATSPSPRTPPRSAPAAAPAPWPACATSPSACCAGRAAQPRRRAAPQRPRPTRPLATLGITPWKQPPMNAHEKTPGPCLLPSLGGGTMS